MSMEVATMASSYKNETEKIVPLMKKFLGNGGTVSDFFGMVDIRAYDLKNKQNDIKLVKTIDFAGVYVLHNQTKNTVFIGKSTHVIKKVERQFSGFENKSIYDDFKNDNKFELLVIRISPRWRYHQVLVGATRCRFNSCYPHQIRQTSLRCLPDFFVPFCRSLGQDTKQAQGAKTGPKPALKTALFTPRGGAPRCAKSKKK